MLMQTAPPLMATHRAYTCAVLLCWGKLSFAAQPNICLETRVVSIYHISTLLRHRHGMLNEGGRQYLDMMLLVSIR